MSVNYVSVTAYGNKDIGCLAPLEPGFDIRRAYVVRGVPHGMTRGGHAHRRQQQVFYCLSGWLTISCEEEPGSKVDWYVGGGQALYVGPMVWHWLTYYDNAIVLALGDEPYDEEEYIRKREEWEGLCSQQ